MAKKTPSPSASTGIKPWQKDVLSVVFLYVVVLFLFSDYVIQNKVFSVGGDVSAGISVSRAAEDLMAAEGEYPLWLPYIFSGMPSHASGMWANPAGIPVVQYQRYLNPFFYISAIVNVLFFHRDHSWEVAIFFFAGLFMFMLARHLGFNHWIALCAAVGFMFCNFFVASVAAGHGGKVKTIAFIPLVVWSVMRFYERRSVLHWSVMAFVMGLFFTDPGHTQIVYYGFMALGIYFLFYAWENFRTDAWGIVKNGAGMGAAMATGLGFGALTYFSQYVYSSVTMRTMAPAFSETGEVAVGSGMTFDYITNWSFHPLESITFFVPTFFGLESPYYWGWMTFTSSAFYFGIIPLVAAVLGAVYRRNTVTKFLVVTAILAWLISFGRYFEPFFKLMLAVLPFFDKFRVPSMILSLFAFAVCLLACYGLDFLFNPAEEEKKKRAGLQKYMVYGLVGALALLVSFTVLRSAMVGLFDLMGENDAARYTTQQIAQLKTMRGDALTGGVVKSSILLAVFFGTVYFFLRQKLSATAALAILVAVSVIDSLTLNRKVLRPQARAAKSAEFQETEAIRFMRSDSSLFRIFPLTEHAQSGSAIWTYFGLENIGGYSPTKMRIYQDIIDFALYKGPDPQFPINMNIVNMLNVKYLIANGQLPAERGFRMAKVDAPSKMIVYENTRRLERAFFVKHVEVLPDKRVLFDRLNSSGFDPAETALLEEDPGQSIAAYDSARAVIVSHRANRIDVQVYVDKPSLLVLSEIHYPHGWKAMVDGKEVPILKTNYILRSVPVPAGEHRVEFVFSPRDFSMGVWTSSIAFFGVTGLMLISFGVTVYRRVRPPRNS